jgi:hypothetical protein
MPLRAARAQYILCHGTANPDGPARQTIVQSGPDTVFTLPKASITVLRGKVDMAGGGS